MNYHAPFVSKNYKILSGFGLGIGSSVINGALDEIYKTKYRHVSEHSWTVSFSTKYQWRKAPR